jgi:hypothetical protein
VEAIMRSFLATVILFCALLPGATLHAQGVYVTRGEKGAVFSDQPQPGAREVILPPLNIVSPPKETPALPPAAAPTATTGRSDSRQAAAFAYRSFSVVWPENDGSVVANTAVFEVRVAVDPPLQLGDGHAFVVSINGRRVDQRFTSTEFMIPPEFWGDVLPPANQAMQLDASIVDGAGQVLQQAAPVRFYLRHATILNHPGRPRPHPPTRPQAPSPPPPRER